MVSFQKDGVSLKTSYRVEFVDNKKDWEYICKGVYVDDDPIDRYKVMEYSDFDEALTFYLVKFFQMCSEKTGFSDVYDVKLFEQVFLDGEIVRESWIEPLSTTLHSLHQTFGREQTEELYDLRKKKVEHVAMLKQYEAFIRSVHAEDHFKKFISHG